MGVLAHQSTLLWVPHNEERVEDVSLNLTGLWEYNGVLGWGGLPYLAVWVQADPSINVLTGAGAGTFTGHFESTSQLEITRLEPRPGAAMLPPGGGPDGSNG